MVSRWHKDCLHAIRTMTAINGDTVTTIIAIGGPCGAVFMLGWWLRNKFQEVEDANIQRTQVLAKVQVDQLAAHERMDQERHKDNVDRLEKLAERSDDRHEETKDTFSDIRAALVKLGVSNGH